VRIDVFIYRRLLKVGRKLILDNLCMDTADGFGAGPGDFLACAKVIGKV